MSAIDSLLENNLRFVEGFSEEAAAAPASPAKRVAVVTCMDARIDPAALLGLAPGDAHVLRNAGGAVTEDVIRSLTVSQRLLGTREIMVIQHTRCGMGTLVESDFKDAIEEETSVRPGFVFEAFSDLEDNLRRSLERIRESPFLRHTDAVRGFIYEVKDGSLREVE